MHLKNNKAITLVALIITIIILLILAGVSLSMILGDNGLINKAQSSVNKYQEAAQKEQNLLQDIEEYMGSYGLSENTPDTPAGTHVKPPAKWLGTMVTAVADGKGNTFPVPKNFYYVGGDYTNGVIISDDPADAYDGTTDKTTWEYTTSLVGNQFVWIPCTPAEYVKTSWGASYSSGEYDSDSPAGTELPQVQKYGGFYVGRYEAGLASTINEFTTVVQVNDNSSPGYNVLGTPKSQAGQVPWNFINYTNSKKSAENMYNSNEKYSDYVSSGLMSGTQWDVMLNKFIGTTNQNNVTFTVADMTNSNKWGNYANNTITYKGRLAKIHNNGTAWYMYPFGEEKTENTTIYSVSGENLQSSDAELLTTGASIQTEAYHTYDVAGNMWEYTEEGGSTPTSHVVRGGACMFGGTKISACYRGAGVVESQQIRFHIGFRVSLFIK